MKKILFLSLFLLPAFCNAQIITTWAGTGDTLHSGDNGPATAAGIASNTYGVFDKYGNYYLSEVKYGRRICKIDTAGIITTIAGTGVAGYSGDGGPATAANLYAPEGIVLDTFGNIFFVDAINSTVRKIDIVSGFITTVAGTGSSGYGGDSGPATAAMLSVPTDVCFDKKGNLYIADAGNMRVRMVNTFGIITTFAGNGTTGYSSDGGPADTTRLNPQGICFDGTGNLYISDASSRIRKVDTSGIISTIAGTGVSGNGGDGGPASSAQVAPAVIRIDRSGNIYVASGPLKQKIRIINSVGIINTFAGVDTIGFSGDGGPATAATLHGTSGIAFDSCDNVYIADTYNHRVRKVTVDTSCGHSVTPLSTSLIPHNGASIFPNPTTASLTITSPSNITSISITNLLGQTVYTNQCSATKVEVDVSRLPAGMYLVRINGPSAGSGQVEVKRFVKE